MPFDLGGMRELRQRRPDMATASPEKRHCTFDRRPPARLVSVRPALVSSGTSNALIGASMVRPLGDNVACLLSDSPPRDPNPKYGSSTNRPEIEIFMSLTVVGAADWCTGN